MESQRFSDPEINAILRRFEQAHQESLRLIQESRAAIEKSRIARAHLKRFVTAPPKLE